MMKEKFDDVNYDLEKSYNKNRYNKKHGKNKPFQDRDRAKPPKKKYKREHIRFDDDVEEDDMY